MSDNEISVISKDGASVPTSMGEKEPLLPRGERGRDQLKGFGARHAFTLMAFFGFANLFAMNSCLSVVIVAMVKNKNGSTPDTGTECPSKLTNETDTLLGGGDFDWNSAEQGLILGSFFYGNIMTQFAGGLLAEKIGGKWVFGGGMTLAVIASFLTPTAAYAGKGFLMAARILLGTGQGVTFSTLMSMNGKWIPSQERSKLVAFTLSGCQFGTFVCLPLSGYFASEFGWESPFYLFGSSGAMWILLWAIIIHSSPEEHPRISKEELEYIQRGLSNRNRTVKLPFPPLLDIIKSPAFIGLVITQMGNSWGMFTLITEIPTYLNNIQHFSLTTNGLLSALPHFLMWLFSMPLSAVADLLITRKIFSVALTRKIYNTIGHTGPALALIGLSLTKCNQYLAVTWLCIAFTLNGAMNSGFSVNHIELSPNYSGTLMGIATTLGGIAGFFATYFAGAYTQGNQTLSTWRVVFLTAAGIYIFDSIVFIILGKSEVQPWNDPEYKIKKMEKKRGIEHSKL